MGKASLPDDPASTITTAKSTWQQCRSAQTRPALSVGGCKRLLANICGIVFAAAASFLAAFAIYAIIDKQVRAPSIAILIAVANIVAVCVATVVVKGRVATAILVVASIAALVLAIGFGMQGALPRIVG